MERCPAAVAIGFSSPARAAMAPSCFALSAPALAAVRMRRGSPGRRLQVPFPGLAARHRGVGARTTAQSYRTFLALPCAPAQGRLRCGRRGQVGQGVACSRAARRGHRASPLAEGADEVTRMVPRLLPWGRCGPPRRASCGPGEVLALDARWNSASAHCGRRCHRPAAEASTRCQMPWARPDRSTGAPGEVAEAEGLLRWGHRELRGLEPRQRLLSAARRGLGSP